MGHNNSELPALPRSRDATPGAEVSLGLLPELLGYHVRRAQTAIFVDFARAVGSEEAITPGLFGMLQVIAANPGLSQSRLAEAMGVDRSVVVGVIHTLEARGLVERRPARDDRRSWALHLTARGRPALRRMEALVLRHEARLASVLSREERRTLVHLLTRLYQPGAGEDAARAPAEDGRESP
jgi:DNA-binding MarR family transcriptional regulator